jgi:serine protease Do
LFVHDRDFVFSSQREILMKKVHTFAVSVVLVIGVLVVINWHRIHFQLDAQESATKLETKKEPIESTQERVGGSRDRRNDAFLVNDVVELLTIETEKLIEKKQTKNSIELRKNLDRTEASIQLPKAISKPLSTQELYRRAAESVFLVAGLTKPTDGVGDWQTAFSTAFAVHEDGILSTSAHVFDHEDHDDAVVVMDVRGQVFPVVEILASNREADTCLFRIDTKGLKPLRLDSTADPGTPIYVMGHPGDSFFYFSAGHIANYEQDANGVLWLNVTADFGQGSSGGPVMDVAGNIVGQVSRTYTLYAGGDTSNRKRRSFRTRQVDDTKATEETKDDSPEADSEAKRRPDPQMVFKSCTPVAAIRALVVNDSARGRD